MDNESETPAPSPLYEADPESLSILFDRIDQKLVKNLPHEILDSDIERLVTYYISERQRFVRDQSQFIKPERKKKTPGLKRSLSDALNDLDIATEI